MTRFHAALLGAAALVLAACTTTAPPVAAAPEDAPMAEVEEAALMASEWIITAIGGQPVIAGHVPTIQFTRDGILQGQSGCNSFRGSFKHSRRSIYFAPFEMTEKACLGGGVMAQEAALAAALKSTVPIALDAEGRLVLTGADGVVVVAEPASFPDLTGSEWQITQMGGTAIISGREPVLEFRSDGQLGGSGGCNSYFGRYEQDGSKLTVTGLGSTRMMCLGDGIMEQERTFLDLLGGITELTIRPGPSGALTLTSESGVSFTGTPISPAPPVVPPDPEVLIGGEWTVEDINRTGIIDNSHLTLTFGADGRVSGSTNCNTFGGVYLADETTLTLAPLAMTQRACTAPAMAHQEQRYMAALNGEMAWTITPDGALELTGPAGQRLLLRR
ncbi:META domain-containing protein [Hyphomonas sp.]|uniref:META domain-containing protein n=1 Tax=Hyphomonas sp. TaxID=87 RepID=UPI0025BA632D|nr:META domain-containing protein [Hyphomonas sp.]